MFEFEFDGELLPFTYNGDKFVLLALLPRRHPRTDFFAAAISGLLPQPSPAAATVASRGCRGRPWDFSPLTHGSRAVSFTLFIVRTASMVAHCVRRCRFRHSLTVVGGVAFSRTRLRLHRTRTPFRARGDVYVYSSAMRTQVPNAKPEDELDGE